MDLFSQILQLLLLSLAVSIDAFFTCMSYAASKIKIPIRANAVISLICSATLLCSSLFAAFLAPLFSGEAAKAICCAIFVLLGIVKLFEEGLKAVITRKAAKNNDIAFSLFNFSFLLTIYADGRRADADCSRHLCCKEAVALAAALSLDGLFCGIGSGFGGGSAVLLLIISLVLTFLMTLLGGFFGRRLARASTHDFSFVGGIILIAVGLFKLI